MLVSHQHYQDQEAFSVAVEMYVGSEEVEGLTVGSAESASGLSDSV
jgi:hypothetical protein